MPDVVGRSLDAANAALSSAAFAGRPQDLLQDRRQIVESNWQVCRQTPGPGPAPQGSAVDLGVVRISETCPGPAPATPTAPPSTTTAPTPTTAPPARPSPTPAPEPAPRPAPKPDPGPAPQDDPPPNDGGGSSGPSAGTVTPGAFCDPPRTGVTSKGTPMICRPGSDRRDRWGKA